MYCIIYRLPIETGMGNPLYAEVTSAGKKKEVMAMCALEACRILDANDMLRPSGAGTCIVCYYTYVCELIRGFCCVRNERTNLLRLSNNCI